VTSPGVSDQTFVALFVVVVVLLLLRVHHEMFSPPK